MNTLLLIGGIGMQEIMFIALIVLLFFGGKKIPELMNGIGKGVRSFKDGLNGMEKDIEENQTESCFTLKILCNYSAVGA